MTPPASASKPRTARPASRRPAQRPPRRVSGPARGARAAAPVVGTPRPGGAVAAPAPLGMRLARTAARIPDARFLDRLLRGRAWIALVAIGLMGIVFIQVSMLRLNAGISRAIASGETLSRQNSTLRGDISKLDSSERIADSAGALGMIEPPAGSVNYLDARKASGTAAARGIHQPKPVEGAATSSTATTATAPPAATQTQTQAAPQTTTQAQAATAPTATTQTTPPATTQAPATTATAPPATTAPTQTQTQAPATTQPQSTAPSTTAPVAPAAGTNVTEQGGQ
jgi:hypothetical protein